MSIKVIGDKELTKSKNIAILLRDRAQLNILPDVIKNEIHRVYQTGDLFEQDEALHVLYPPGKEIQRILLYVIKDKNKFTANIIEKACAHLVKRAIQLKVKTLTFDIASFNLLGMQLSEAALTLSMISQLAIYQYNMYKHQTSETKKLVIEIIFAGSQKQACQRAAKQGEVIAKAINHTRSLANQPANKIFPQSLANAAKTIASQNSQITCMVLQKKELEKKGFGALLAVGSGSQRPPVLIAMQYKGGKQGQAPIALVGKGITFDSGGISLKPSAKMDEMRYDMSGAATVLGIMQAAAELKLPVNLIGVIPSAENMPSGTACRPGDIVKSLSGQTIEILNTDAEGRLILADALTYAKKYNPKVIIDFATLTGAVIVALGHVASGLVSNNDALSKSLEEASQRANEKIWRLPLWDEYKDLIKSENADIANIGKEPGAGTIVGAAFLEKFVGETPWAHLDIAGTAWGVGGPLFGKGATGVGIRLILAWLENQSE